jgi:hypothetical protein
MDALPKMCDYSEKTPSLPSGTENFNVTCYPVNGSSFTPSQQIIVDLNNVGYLDPSSISIRYKLSLGIANGDAANTTKSIVGCPVYSPFLRLDTLFNSNVVESINNYNVVCTALSNLQYGVSEKMGMQSALGYYEQSFVGGASLGALTDYSTINENVDGLTVQTVAAMAAAATVNYYLSAPLPSLLLNAEKLIPLNGTNIRLQFTLDALNSISPGVSAVGTNITGTAPAGGQVPFSSLTITNFEVVYNQIQFPPQIERYMLDMPKIRIKTSSYATGLQSISAGVAGTVNLVYNLRYASIKSMFLLLGSSSGNATNKLFDSIDMTSGGGSYGFVINGLNFPMSPLSTVNNRGGVLMELRRAMQNIYTGSNQMAIDNNEWLKGDTTVAGTGLLGVTNTQTSVNIPAKFIVGVNTQKMMTPAIFTGVSSQNSPITAIINVGSQATGLAYSPILTLLYDAMIEIDTLTKQVNYIY